MDDSLNVSSSEEGDYDMDASFCKAKEDEPSKEVRGKVCSLPDLASNFITSAESNALQLAFRNRNSICVETTEFLQVFFKILSKIQVLILQTLLANAKVSCVSYRK